MTHPLIIRALARGYVDHVRALMPVIRRDTQLPTPEEDALPPDQGGGIDQTAFREACRGSILMWFSEEGVCLRDEAMAHLIHAEVERILAAETCREGAMPRWSWTVDEIVAAANEERITSQADFLAWAEEQGIEAAAYDADGIQLFFVEWGVEDILRLGSEAHGDSPDDWGRWLIAVPGGSS